MVAGADDGERATGSSPTDRQIPRTDTGRLPARDATALNDQRNSPFFLLSPTRAREAGAAALWLMAARWSPAPTMVSELPGHRQPIAKFRALTLAACPRARRYGFERSAE